MIHEIAQTCIFCQEKYLGSVGHTCQLEDGKSTYEADPTGILDYESIEGFGESVSLPKVVEPISQAAEPPLLSLDTDTGEITPVCTKKELRQERMTAIGDCIIKLAQYRETPGCLMKGAVMECVKILEVLLQKEVNKR